MLYRSERHWRTKRNFEVFRAHDFIAALVTQIPAKGVPSVRYHGWYSNKSRGLRRKMPATTVPDTVSPLLPRRRRRTRWRELIQRVWGADPLRCPLCPGLLRPIERIETPVAIRAFLEPLGLYEHATGRPAHVAELEQKVAAERKQALAALPAQYGFEDMPAFIRALRQTTARRRARITDAQRSKGSSRPAGPGPKSPPP